MDPRHRHPTQATASPARASSNTLWRSRSTLYKVSILLLMVVWPLNFLSVVLPYWLEAEGKVEGSMSKVDVNYGFWTLCAEGSGCYDVHSVRFDVGVGVWMYAAALFTLLSVVCHAVASLCGALQNFLPRRISRECTCFLKRMLHRDCAYAEDVGFIAGFLGMTANIIVMMSTKEVVSSGAKYSYSFGLSFLSTAIALIASVALTKAHCISHPAPRRQSGSRAQHREPVQVHHGGAAASASMDVRDSASNGRVGVGSSASATMELGDMRSLREQANTDSASLRVQLGAPFRGSGDSDATAYEQRRSRDHYDPERYSAGPGEGYHREQREPRDRYSDQKEIYEDQRDSHKDYNALQSADAVRQRSSHSHGEHENQAYVREQGDCTDANSRDSNSPGSNQRQPQEHRSRQDFDEGYSRPRSSPDSAARPKHRGATAYWRGREEESTRPQDLDAKVLEESDQVREAERKTRWHGRSSSRSRSRSRSRERRHGRRRQSSGDSSSATTIAGNNATSQTTGNNPQQSHSSGNSRTKGLVRSVEMENIPAAVSLGSSSSAKRHPLLNSTQPHPFGNFRTSGLMRSLEVENIPAAVSSAADPSPRSTVPPSLRQQTPHTEHLRSSPLKRNTSPPASSKAPATDVTVRPHDVRIPVRIPANDVRNRNSRVSNSKVSAGVEASRSTRL